MKHAVIIMTVATLAMAALAIVGCTAREPEGSTNTTEIVENTANGPMLSVMPDTNGVVWMSVLAKESQKAGVNVGIDFGLHKSGVVVWKVDKVEKVKQPAPVNTPSKP